MPLHQHAPTAHHELRRRCSGGSGCQGGVLGVLRIRIVGLDANKKTVRLHYSTTRDEYKLDSPKWHTYDKGQFTDPRRGLYKELQAFTSAWPGHKALDVARRARDEARQTAIDLSNLREEVREGKRTQRDAFGFLERQVKHAVRRVDSVEERARRNHRELDSRVGSLESRVAHLAEEWESMSRTERVAAFVEDGAHAEKETVHAVMSRVAVSQTWCVICQEEHPAGEAKVASICPPSESGGSTDAWSHCICRESINEMFVMASCSFDDGVHHRLWNRVAIRCPACRIDCACDPIETSTDVVNHRMHADIYVWVDGREKKKLSQWNNESNVRWDDVVERKREREAREQADENDSAQYSPTGSHGRGSDSTSGDEGREVVEAQHVGAREHAASEEEAEQGAEQEADPGRAASPATFAVVFKETFGADIPDAYVRSVYESSKGVVNEAANIHICANDMKVPEPFLRRNPSN